jgi:hypothetical protein
MALVQKPQTTLLDPNAENAPRHEQAGESPSALPLRFAKERDYRDEEREGGAPASPIIGELAGAAPPDLTVRSHGKDKFPVRLVNKQSLGFGQLGKMKLYPMFAKTNNMFTQSNSNGPAYCAFSTVLAVREGEIGPDTETHPVILSPKFNNVNCAGLATFSYNEEGMMQTKIDETFKLDTNYHLFLLVDGDTHELMQDQQYVVSGTVVTMEQLLGLFPDLEGLYKPNTQHKVERNGKKSRNLRRVVNEKAARTVLKQEEPELADLALAQFFLTPLVFLATGIEILPNDAGQVFVPARFMDEMYARAAAGEALDVPDDAEAARANLQFKLDQTLSRLHIGPKVNLYVGPKLKYQAKMGQTREEHNRAAWRSILEKTGGNVHTATIVAEEIMSLESLNEAKFFNRARCFDTVQEAEKWIEEQDAETRSMYRIIDTEDVAAEPEDADDAGPSRKDKDEIWVEALDDDTV